ncbi:hypothetical protein WJX82_011500 [Trebouxia sp. C0006]
MKPIYRLQQPTETISNECLSPEILKKQERLAKNRAIASVSRAHKRLHLQNLQARVVSLERENILLSQKITLREAELRQMQTGSSVQCEGTEEILQKQKPMAMDEAPTSPKASDSRDMEPVAAGQYHVPSISVVQASTPGHEVKGAPVAPYNMITSGEYASANKREIIDSMAPRSPFSPPPHRHLISDVITGSDSSQELPHHSSIQQESSGWKQEAWHESRQQQQQQPQQHQHHQQHQQHQQQQQHHQQQQQQQHHQQQQQQQVCLSSSGQDAPAQGLTDWEPLPFKTLDMITSMDDMSDNGFAAEASRWIVRNYGSHIPTESLASAGSPVSQ